jgi:hypothetical protein
VSIYEDERGACANCGADMDFTPSHPWCADCDFKDEEDEAREKCRAACQEFPHCACEGRLYT